MIGVYKIISPSGGVYIGQSINLLERIKTYRNNRCKQQRKLFHSFKKYGFDAHKIEILHVLNDYDKKRLDDLEIELIRSYRDSGCTMLNLSYNSITNGKHHEETKKLISAARVKQSPPTKGMVIKPKVHTCKLPDQRGKWWAGKSHTEESKAKQRLKKIGSKNRTKIVLNTRTGVYYDTLTEAAFSVGKSMKALSNQMRGKARNYTGLVYA